MALGEAGAVVVVADLDPSLADNGARAVTQAGGTAHGLPIDVTRTETVDAAVDAVRARHGRVDILVCNAGIVVSEIKAEDLDDANWLRQIDVNLNGVFRCCRAFGRVMLEQGRAPSSTSARWRAPSW